MWTAWQSRSSLASVKPWSQSSRKRLAKRDTSHVTCCSESIFRRRGQCRLGGEVPGREGALVLDALSPKPSFQAMHASKK